MQMSEDDGPSSKRLKTQSSSDFDLSALNDLPDSLLTNQPVNQNIHQNGPTSQPYLAGMLSSTASSTVNTIHQNGSMLPTATFSITTQPSAAATVFTNHQQLQRRSLPTTTPTHSLSTLQSVNPSSLIAQQQQQPRSQPLVSAVRPQIQQLQRHLPVQAPPLTSPTNQAALSNDPDKQRLITQQLVLLLHAHKCVKRAKEGPNDIGDDVCPLHHCKTMKVALKHMMACQNGKRCTEMHCVSSRQIIAHWKNCNDAVCPVCLPLKSVSHKKNKQNAGLGVNNMGMSLSSAALGNVVSRPNVLGNTLTRLPNHAVSSNSLNLNHTSLASLMQNGTPQQHQQQQRQRILVANQQPMVSQLTNQQPVVNQMTNQQPVLNQMTNQQPVSSQLANQQMMPQQRVAPPSALQTQLSSPLSSRVIINTSQGTMSQQPHLNAMRSLSTSSPAGSLLTVGRQVMTGAPAASPPQAINLDEMKKAYAALGLEYNPNNTPPSAQIHQPLQQPLVSTSPPVRLQKEWHNEVPTTLRKHLIQKLVHAIFPSPDPQVINDPRMINLLHYAKKVESDMFNIANNREEYYQKLAEKIYKIRRELDEKRKQRQRQEQQKQAAKALLTTSDDPMLLNTKPEPLVTVKQEPLLRPYSSSSDAGSASLTSPKVEATNSFSVTKTLLQKPVKTPKQEAMTPPEPKPSPSTPSPAPAPPPVEKKVVPKKLWRSDELKSVLMPLVVKLTRLEEAMPFRLPVDPVALNIPDYFDIVKKPMDLSTVQKKLEKGDYQSPWDFVNDVWQMFDNAWMYNKKTSRVYKCCTKLSELFEGDINVIMKKLGFCCGKRYFFYPNVLVCYGKDVVACTIAQYQAYHAYDNRYTFCDKCFSNIDSNTIELTDELTGKPLTIPRDQFIHTKNDVLEPEEMTECRDCERSFHCICVQHMKEMSESGYLCDGCLKIRNQKRKENKYSAKRLPICKLSTHIEERVNEYLTKKNIISDGEVFIRILSYTEKETDIKQGMRERFPKMESSLPYKCKAMFAFQYSKQQNREVCFFSMYVQEYDSKVPEPNTSRVYISYLDSIHFFAPREYRTAVYHEILIGYFDYVRKLGYQWGHIWACPPSEGDDYIFHAHPSEQKVPKPKRLQEWYKKMLDKAIIEGVVADYKDIYKDAIEKRMQSADELPYFDGDYWTTILEDCIKECQEEELKKKQEEDRAMEADELEDHLSAEEVSFLEAALSAEDSSSSTSTMAEKISVKSKKSKGNKQKNPKKSSGKKSTQSTQGNDLSDKLFSNIEKQRDMFFVLRLKSLELDSGSVMLKSPYDTLKLDTLPDPDPIITSELMDARDSFLTMCREKHWEFSSLRRASYSTMAFLYEIHTTGRDGFVYTCNTCKAQVETRYHCSTCEDFDLCIPCFNKNGHVHKMDKLGLGIEGGESTDSKLSPAETRKRSLQRCIDSLVHASQCRDANCKLAVCEKMKRVVSHTKMCKRKKNGGCPICKQLIALCCYHAKICKENMCPVPFCNNIKQKVKQQHAAQRQMQDRMLQRRVANTQQMTRPVARQLPTTNNAAIHAQLQRVSVPQSQAYSSHNSLIAQSNVAYTHNAQQQRLAQHQPQQVTNAQSSLLQQQISVPASQSEQIRQQIQRRQQLQQRQSLNSAGIPQPIILNQGNQNVQVVHPLQHQPQHQAQHQAQIPPQQQMVVSQPQSQMMTQQRPGQSQAPVGSASDAARQAAKLKMQNLLALVRNGRQQTPEEKRQLVALLKSNPTLMNMFMNQKKVQQQRQQQLQLQQQGITITRPLNQMAGAVTPVRGGANLISRLQQPMGAQPSAQVSMQMPARLPLPAEQSGEGPPGQSHSAQEQLSRFVDSL